MSGPSYTREQDYAVLLAAVRAVPGDETPRLVLADWVQDHGDDTEAAAIRNRCSLEVDYLPALERCFRHLAARITELDAATSGGPADAALAGLLLLDIRNLIARILLLLHELSAVGPGT